MSEETTTGDNSDHSATLEVTHTSDISVAKSHKGKGKAGRPTKLTKEIIAKSCEHVSFGVPLEVSFEAQGINRASYFRWKKAAEEGEEPYASAFDKINASKAELLVKMGGKYMKLLNKSERLDDVWRAMHRQRPDIYPLEQPGGIQVNNSVRTNMLVAGAPGGPGGPALGDANKGQLTVEGADAVRRSVLLGGKSPTEVIRDFKRLKSGDSDTVDTEGEGA